MTKNDLIPIMIEDFKSLLEEQKNSFNKSFENLSEQLTNVAEQKNEGEGREKEMQESLSMLAEIYLKIENRFDTLSGRLRKQEQQAEDLFSLRQNVAKLSQELIAKKEDENLLCANYQQSNRLLQLGNRVLILLLSISFCVNIYYCYKNELLKKRDQVWIYFWNSAIIDENSRQWIEEYFDKTEFFR